MLALRYSILRILIFTAALFTFYLLGVRNPWILLVVAALVSMIASYLLLSDMRNDLARQIEDRMVKRQERLSAQHRDETDEDAEDEVQRSKHVESEDDFR